MYQVEQDARGVHGERVDASVARAHQLSLLRALAAKRHPWKDSASSWRLQDPAIGFAVMVVTWDGYAYLVPYVEEAEFFLLKTVIPSRKATRDYTMTGNPDDPA